MTNCRHNAKLSVDDGEGVREDAMGTKGRETEVVRGCKGYMASESLAKKCFFHFFIFPMNSE